MPLRFSFDFPERSMPRTVYYDRLVLALKGLPGYQDAPEYCDLLFPLEDTSLETNWPRYARSETAFIRGAHDRARHDRYLTRLSKSEAPLCIINMHPFIRVPMQMLGNPNIIVADINLRVWERTLVPKSISMPALPITVGTFKPEQKRIMAGFRGVDSHPCRRELAKLHNGTSIVAEMVDKTNHFGQIDAEKGEVDPAYVKLMEATIFAFVPRGDAEFSYRLLEAMSFGCIPIILADGLVLPFDRIIPWSDFSLHMPEGRISDIPDFLSRISPDRIAKMQHGVNRTYRQNLSRMESIASCLLEEINMSLLYSDAENPALIAPEHLVAAMTDMAKARIPKPRRSIWPFGRKFTGL